MGAFRNLLGTLEASFKIGKAKLDAAALTTTRALALPDRAGTVQLTPVFADSPPFNAFVGMRWVCTAAGSAACGIEFVYCDDGTSFQWVEFDATGSSVDSGPAFPTSPAPANGQRWFRTDLGLDCYYSAAAANWLTVQLFSVEFNAQGQNVSGSVANAGGYLAVSSLYDLWLEHIVGFNISTTNNATNYWTFSLRKVQVSAGPTTIVGWNTSAYAAGQNVRQYNAIGALVDHTLYPRIDLLVSFTGAPSAANASYALYYRLVVT